MSAAIATKVALSKALITASVLVPAATEALVKYYDNLAYDAKFAYARKAIESEMRGDPTWPDYEDADEERWGESIQATITKKVEWASRTDAPNPAQAKRARIKQEKADTTVKARSAAMSAKENAMVRAACAEAGISVSSTEGKRLRRVMRNAAAIA